MKADNGGPSAQEDEALRMFNAFRAKLEKADGSDRDKARARKQAASTTNTTAAEREREEEGVEDEEEAQLCDLHFIANCQSCRAWDEPAMTGDSTADTGTNAAHNREGEDDADSSGAWMTHRLKFAKDTLGKDATWKRDHPEDADGLMVIDPRQKEKEIIGGVGGRKRERERKRRMEGGGSSREWDQRAGGKKGR